MIKQLLLLFAFLLFQNFIYSQVLGFSKTYSSDAYDDIRSLVKGNDGTFYFTGLDLNTQDSAGDMYLTKINATGSIIWKKYYGLPKEDGGNFLLATKDGGFLICGHSNNTPDEECDGYLVKLDKDGNQLWTLFVGSILDDVCYGAVEASDGSFYITGRTEEPDNNYVFDVLVTHISSNGKIEWLKSLPGSGSEIGYKICFTADNNLFIAGFKTFNSGSDEDIYVAKCDTYGNLIWDNSFGTKLNDKAYGLFVDEEGNAIVAGGSAEPYSFDNPREMLVYKIKSNGYLLDKKVLNLPGTYGYLFDGLLNRDHNFLFTGNYKKTINSIPNPVVVVTDQDFNVLNIKIIEVDYPTKSNTIVELENKSVIMAGFTRKGIMNFKEDSWIGRTLESDDLNIIEEDIAELDFVMYPNPSNNFCYFKVGKDENTKKMEFFNVSGKLVSVHFFISEIFIYKSDLKEPGLYFYTISDESGNKLKRGSVIFVD